MSKIEFNWNLAAAEEKVRNEINAQNEVLLDILKRRITISPPEAEKLSQQKYFKNANVKDDSGNAHDGWGIVLKYLKSIAGDPEIEETKVDIELKLKDTSDPYDHDLVMKKLKTKFKFKSKEGASSDPTIEGTLLHRRVCEFEP